MEKKVTIESKGTERFVFEFNKDVKLSTVTILGQRLSLESLTNGVDYLYSREIVERLSHIKDRPSNYWPGISEGIVIEQGDNRITITLPQHSFLKKRALFQVTVKNLHTQPQEARAVFGFEVTE